MEVGTFDVWNQPNFNPEQYVLTIFQTTYWGVDLVIIVSYVQQYQLSIEQLYKIRKISLPDFLLSGGMFLIKA